MRTLFALATAMLLTRPRRGVNAYRTLFYMPSMAPAVGATLVFVYLFNPATGPINNFLEQIPGITAPLWFLDPQLVEAGAGDPRASGARATPSCSTWQGS